MRVLRWIGIFFLLAACLVLIADIYGAIIGSGFRWSALGEIWFRLGPESLNFFQVIIQRYIWPDLWTFGVQPVLLWPAAPTLAALGLILGLIGRRRRRRFP